MALSIKICGMTHPGNISEIAGLAPDYLGLIFHSPSPRNACALRPEAIESARAGIKLTGVFVDRQETEVLQLAESFRLSAVQLHGCESPEYCRKLKGRGFEVWKAVGIEDENDFLRMERYAGCIDRFVFDRKSPSHGGTGVKFDWQLLRHYQLPIGFMLGGGIGPDDAEAIACISHPQLVGLDLNSRFESSPGTKDYHLLDKFLTRIRKS
ncbi:phosphoribosylanthranilate isomerase [uncultured Duncaniella sp.]|uniref:phosphoribosylanthranilate isomerase n=1 Tax=uncultured Duncaniella sp. TaxID=2768039 RepID=UPI0025E01CF0|nr:phosphoribosylanthranilate isomerase [uncultured Duncaniella sp.]